MASAMLTVWLLVAGELVPRGVGNVGAGVGVSVDAPSAFG